MVYESVGIFTEILAAVCVALFVYFVMCFLKQHKLPPGPYGLPIVGYIPFLTKDVHLKFVELSQKYGEVFSLRLGSETVVVLCSTKVIREAFSKKEFLGRPPFSSFSFLGSASPFFQQDMHVWQEQRRFVVHSLKDLGLGRSKIEESVQDEIRHFIQRLESYNGQPIDIKEPLTPSISNNICALTFGKRYEYDDPERLVLDDSLDKVTRAIGQTASHIFFPWIRHFNFILKFLNYDEAVEAFKRTDVIFESNISEHKKNLDPRNIGDFIDSYLIEIATQKAKNPNTTFKDETLVGLVGDLFGAGSETVRTSISWCIYIVAAYPQVQQRVLKEVRDTLGADRLPEYGDLKAMPYTHAVILEMMRWKSIVPLNVLRYTLEDTRIGDYDIPRNTIVMANFWAVHHDPRFWEDPDTFKPERFLTPDEKSIEKSQHYMPFSVGKRACPGESMAYMEIFLYFASLVQKFDIQFPKGVKPTFDAELTITYNLKPYQICLLPRENQ